MKIIQITLGSQITTPHKKKRRKSHSGQEKVSCVVLMAVSRQACTLLVMVVDLWEEQRRLKMVFRRTHENLCYASPNTWLKKKGSNHLRTALEVGQC